MTPSEIREARAALGLSRIRLGALAGVTEKAVAKAEAGRTVGPAILAALIRCLHEAGQHAGARPASGAAPPASPDPPGSDPAPRRR